MKEQLNSYFSFSKKELNGIFILFIVLTLILSFPFFYRFFDDPETYDPSGFRKEIALFKASAVKREGNLKFPIKKVDESVRKPEYFEFDPNSATSDEWHRLGFSPRQIKVIANYLSKGGKFYRTEDVKKIYSITEKQYLGLQPYIKIKSDKLYPVLKHRMPNPNYKATRVVENMAKVELNSVDSASLDELKGIGPAFASRIIKLRNRLGGYHAKEQLKEVYGMDSLRYAQLGEQIVVDPSAVRKLKLNAATFDELRNHPYLTFKQINAIIQYRKQHGNYRSVDDLKKVLVLNDEIIRKIGPYLSFDP